MSMYEAKTVGPAEPKEGKPRLRVSASVSSFGVPEDNSWRRERHARLKKEIALVEKELANWDAEAIAAQALKALKADLVRLRGDLLACEAEMDIDGEAEEVEVDEEDSGDSEDSEDTDDSEDEAIVAKGNPYSVIKRGGKYVIENNETGKVKGSHATKAKAMKQFRLLEGIEHGWEPREK